MGSTKRWGDEDLILAVRGSVTYADVVRSLGLSDKSAGNWATVQKHIKRLELDVSHFDQYHKMREKGVSPARDLSDIMVSGSTYKTTSLARRLISEGLRTRRCENCGLTEWFGAPIPLELDHINGTRNDHRNENLRLLCPNCHALTPTWRGRGKKKPPVLCDCGKPKFRTSPKCRECWRFEWPDKSRIQEMHETMSLAAIGRHLGVTGQAVGRRIKEGS